MLGLFAGLLVLGLLLLCCSVTLTRRTGRELLGLSIRRVAKFLRETRRKSFHVSGVFVPFIYYVGLKNGWLTQHAAAITVGSVFAVVFSVECFRLLVPAFNEKFIEVLGGMLRPHERTRLSGTSYYLCGCFLTVYFCPPIGCIYSLLCLTIGDLCAALVGLSMGRTKIANGKSLEGSLGCFAVCFAMGLLTFRHMHLVEYYAFAGALAATAAELWAPCDDNLAIPAVTGATLLLVQARLRSPLVLP
eukprot:tig00000553_g2114.t1